ncbi:uncharacterized protein B0I36DRAFT_369745 [Microdochium trichocladiopsis]|nr:uncharacterized protein B0I36DRAFT_369745 [Microdochium trichocladiopsis]KAH7012602.1 hypothetical protein B0I36DRAFT_369745 [Microdochium trichocladiopsis]
MSSDYMPAMTAPSPQPEKRMQMNGTMGLIFIKKPDGLYVWLHQRRKKTTTLVDGKVTKVYGGEHSFAGPGGGAELGETPEHSILREVAEEYLVDPEIIPIDNRNVLAETDDRMADGSFWRCHFYLLNQRNRKQRPQIAESEKEKATHVEQFKWSEIFRAIEAAAPDGETDRIKTTIEGKDGQRDVYFFASLINLVRERPDLKDERRILDAYEKAGAPLEPLE